MSRRSSTANYSFVFLEEVINMANKKLWQNCLIILVSVIVIASSTHSRRKGSRQYKNALMRMHYHAWSFGDILDAILRVAKSFLVPLHETTSRYAPFVFLLDLNNNGSSSFWGLNVSQRDATYDIMVKVFEWIGFIITEHFFVTYIDQRGQQ